MRADTLEVPMGIQGIPYTFYSPQGSEHENVVAFRHWNTKGINTKHNFIFEENDSQTEASHHPEYHFLSDSESHEFQSRVRGRRLLKTFDTEVISIVQSHTFRSSTPNEYARKVPIKLWRRTDTAITFFATFDGVKHQTHLQFYLSWFGQAAELNSDKKLTLRFNRQHDIDREHDPPTNEHKRKRSFASITSKGKRQRDKESKQRRTSLAESSSQRTLKIHDGELKTDASVKDTWESLEILFTRNGG